MKCSVHCHATEFDCHNLSELAIRAEVVLVDRGMEEDEQFPEEERLQEEEQLQEEKQPQEEGRRRRSRGKRSSRMSKTTGYLVFKIRIIYHHQVRTTTKSEENSAGYPSRSTGTYVGRASSEKEKETGAVVALRR